MITQNRKFAKLIAPVLEEILKSLVLVYYVRRPDFTYFVDGAIYGFAAGTAFSFVGLRVERGWIEETLGLSLGVTDREVEVVMRLNNLDELLRPIVDRFGEKRARMVKRFLLKQAQLGIKRKAWELAEDARLKAGLGKQAKQLQRESESPFS